jgi:hypothetical protein
MEIVEQTQTLTLDAIEQEAKAKYALAQHLAATAKDAARDAVLGDGRLRADAANGQGACARA